MSDSINLLGSLSPSSLACIRFSLHLELFHTSQIARASTVPESSYIAKPAASWLDDFLVWMSPEAFGCCRKFTNGSYCPPDDQGVMAILNIQLNAISIVNLVMSIGIAIEFCVHIIYAFLASTGDRENRMREALSTVGASVFSGITLTKLIGVIVQRFAKSEVFVVYFFQMYLALLLIGFLHGLVFLPVVLSICGPPSTSVLVENKNAPNEKQEHQVLNSATHSS